MVAALAMSKLQLWLCVGLCDDILCKVHKLAVYRCIVAALAVWKYLDYGVLQLYLCGGCLGCVA